MFFFLFCENNVTMNCYTLCKRAARRFFKLFSWVLKREKLNKSTRVTVTELSILGELFLMHLTETKYGQWGDRTKWSQRVHYGSVARGEAGPLCWSIQLFHIHLSDWSLNVCYISIGTEHPSRVLEISNALPIICT